MKLNNIKKIAVAATILFATAAVPATALAGGYGGYGHVPHADSYSQRHQYYGGHRRHGNHYGRGICHPGEAVEKAHWLGMRRPGVERVNHREVIVSGRSYGHWARIAFDRNSRNCRVLWSRGI
ncbi:MAG: hypothetical protein WBO55_03855 [Rhizobiaceae bacterium]